MVHDNFSSFFSRLPYSRRIIVFLCSTEQHYWRLGELWKKKRRRGIFIEIFADPWTQKVGNQWNDRNCEMELRAFVCKKKKEE